MASRPFGQLVLTIDEITEVVSTYTARAAEKSRHQRLVCRALHVFVRTNPFRQKNKQYNNGIVVPLPESNSNIRLLVSVALFGLERIYQHGYWYKKAGVMLMEISDVRRTAVIAI